MAIPVLDESSFDDFLSSSDLPVLVDFWAEWCAPCKALDGVLVDLAEELADRMRVAKVDVDSVPQLAARFEVLTIPTLILFRRLQEVDRIKGAFPKSKLVERLLAHL